VWRRYPAARTSSRSASENPSRAYLGGSVFKGGDQRKRSGPCRAGAKPGAPREAPEARREPAPLGRADERPGRRRCAIPRGALLSFPGCAVVITHDRWFWTASRRILAFEGDSGSCVRGQLPRLKRTATVGSAKRRTARASHQVPAP
jgi:hypothetical protein